jgi:hypothetical protein
MTMLRIARVQPLSGRSVSLTLTDGTVVERDLQDLLRLGGVFTPIDGSDAVFRRVRVRHGTLVWPGDIDLDPDVLIWGGAPPPDGSSRRPPHRSRVAVPA